PSSGTASGTTTYREGSDPDHSVTLGTHLQDAPPDAPPDAPTILDVPALTALLLGAADVAGRDDPAAHDQALDVVTALTLAAGGIGTLAAVLHDDGPSGLVAQLEAWATTGALTWVTDAVVRGTTSATSP